MKAFKGGLLGCLGVGAAILLVIIVIVVIASASKSSSTTGSSASSSPHPVAAVGQPMKNDAGQTVTVASFQRNVAVTNQFEQPTAGNECVSVNLTLVNGGSIKWTLPLFEMAIVDANGQSHSQAIGTCGGSGTSIDSLIPTGHANATLLFEVPKGSTLAFTWTPNALNPNSNYQTALK
jgi:hypothetical protein